MPAGGSLHAAVARNRRSAAALREAGRPTVFKFAVRKTEEIARRILARNGLRPDDLDLFVSHQANRRIIKAATEKLEIAAEKVVINIERFGNTTAATIPLALNDAVCCGAVEERRSGAAGLGRRRLHGRLGPAALGILEGLFLRSVTGNSK